MHLFEKPALQKLILLTGLVAVLYGLTYQQFRHFNPDDPRGGQDSSTYRRISRGDYGVVPVRRYRPVIPLLARIVRVPVSLVVHSEVEQDKLAFYVVNFTMTFFCAVAFFCLLQTLGFSNLLSCLGVLLFASSRVVILATGIPLVDSFYFLAIAVIVLFTLRGNIMALALSMPILALSKETILPVLFLPLLTRKGRHPAIWSSLSLSLILVYAMRRCIRALATTGHSASDIGDVVTDHLRGIGGSLRQLLSLRGLHDVQCGFSALLALAVVGFVVNQKHRLHKIPPYLYLFIPMGIGYAMLSGNLGRMFFSCYVVVIPLALISVEYALGSRQEKQIDCDRDVPAEMVDQGSV
jgi:hypothetical protein